MESPLANRVFLLPHRLAVRFLRVYTARVRVYRARLRVLEYATLGHTSTCRVGDRTDGSGPVSRLGLTRERDLLS